MHVSGLARVIASLKEPIVFLWQKQCQEPAPQSPYRQTTAPVSCKHKGHDYRLH